MKDNKQKKSLPAWALFLILAIAGLCFGVFMAWLCVHEGWIQKPEPFVETSDELLEGEVLAYSVYSINSNSQQIGCIYLVESMLTVNNTNPKTGKPFTEKEIANIKTGTNTAHLDEGYVMGITTPEGLKEGINEYLENEAQKVLPLFAKQKICMDTESGSLYSENKNQKDIYVEHCLAIIISVMDEEGNIGKVYYPIEYIDTKHINPYTKTYFDEEEVASLLSNSETWILYDGTYMMIEPFATGVIWSYSEEEMMNAVSYKGHMNLNPTSGQLSSDDNQVIANAMEKE